MTPITDPKAAKRSMKVLTPGCWSLNTVVSVTATIIPVTRKMLNAKLNLFSLEGSISAQRYSFFLIISIPGAALLCLAGCDKAVTTTPTPQQLKLNLTINNGMAPATKSVKTEWTDGDKVYVFFGKPADQIRLHFT